MARFYIGTKCKQKFGKASNLVLADMISQLFPEVGSPQ